MDQPVLQDVTKSFDFLFFVQRHVIHPLLDTDQLVFQYVHVISGRSKRRCSDVESDALVSREYEIRRQACNYD